MPLHSSFRHSPCLSFVSVSTRVRSENQQAWAVMSGLGILFNINTGSLRQAIVPNHMLGRVISIASVLAWSAIPLGSFLGGLAIEWTRNVVLVYAVIGVLTFLIPFSFSFTALGHA